MKINLIQDVDPVYKNLLHKLRSRSLAAMLPRHVEAVRKGARVVLTNDTTSTNTNSPTTEPPRRFRLVRHVDVSGVSGVGIVASGAVFDSGAVVLHWPSPRHSVAVWPSITAMLDVHGHGGATSVDWIDPSPDAGR